MSLNPVGSLYRRSLKLALDWAVHRHTWRGQAVYIRSLFEANKDVRDPRQQKVLLRETENLLETWKHPDPHRFPTAPGGNLYERNIPAPRLPRMLTVHDHVVHRLTNLSCIRESLTAVGGFPGWCWSLLVGYGAGYINITRTLPTIVTE